MEPVIRSAVPEDTSELIACIDAAFCVYDADGFDFPDVSGGVAGSIGTDEVWVAEKAKRIVGGLIAIPHRTCWRLSAVAVHPDHGGEGIGTRLINTCIAAARNAKASEIRLTTHVGMLRNIEMYTRQGWQRSGQDDHRVFMTRDLSESNNSEETTK